VTPPQDLRRRNTTSSRLCPSPYAGYTLFRAVADIEPTDAFPRGLGREIWGPGMRFGTMMVQRAAHEDRLYWYAAVNARENELFLRPFRPALSRRFRGWPYLTQELIEATAEMDILRHDVREYEPASFGWTRGRVAVLGNAAHPMTPNLHQSTSMSVEDGFCVAHMVAVHGVEGGAFEKYERLRKARTLSFVMNSRKVGYVAQMEHPTACQARDFVLEHRLLRNYVNTAAKLMSGFTGFEYSAL